MESELLSPGELAEHLKVRTGALAHWRHRGEGPRFIKVGGAVRYRRSDVALWLDSQTQQQATPRTDVQQGSNTH